QAETSKMACQNNEIVVVGGGLVGCLAAIFWAKRGYQVDLYEMREDFRLLENTRGKSINLALSSRGILSLKHAGLDDEVTNYGIPMYGRMIHSVNGECSSQAYSPNGEVSTTIALTILFLILILAAEKYKNIHFHFRHKLKSAVLSRRELKFDSVKHGEIMINAKTILGCDGAYSRVRQSMMREARLNYLQSYIGHVYVELIIPPRKDGEFAIEPNYLHIWPRETLMLIALPNLDKSFTCTLFIPLAMKEELITEKHVLDLFATYFPDVIDLIGSHSICHDVLNNPADELVYIKCDPHHYADHTILLGDAAHAFVPFYGQGLNCGFEDCLVLDRILVANGFDLEKSFQQYSETRIRDTDSICDLSLYNYHEMRSHVNSKVYLLRRAIDNVIFRLLPNTYIPLYTMVC
ncbi:uncharacterized protein TRIADDRAFT_24922, partial [Trichoplax adhaerens]